MRTARLSAATTEFKVSNDSGGKFCKRNPTVVHREKFFQEDAVSHLVAHNGLLTASVTMSTGWFVWFKWTLKQANDFKVKKKRTPELLR